MHKRVVVFAVGAVLTAAIAAADVDLSDFDDDVMRAMDDSIKDLEPVIAAGNAAGAGVDAQAILDGLKWTEEYFTKKGNTEDAVKFARASQDLTVAVQKALAANDFEAAARSARALSKSCRTCHDLYKPLTK